MKNWKTALAAMGLILKQKPTMVFEIDDANGKKLVFPDANDFTEVVEGANVTAEDGEYAITVDGIVSTITVLSGTVTTIVVSEPSAVEPLDITAAIDPKIIELFQLMGAQLESNEVLFSEMKVDFTELKATMSHGGDGGEPIPQKSRFNTNQIKK